MILPVRRGMVVAAVILLSTWAVAGVVNANASLTGSMPSVVGVAATLLVICVWPMAGWLTGSTSGTGFVRLATVFWGAVAAGTPLVAWAFAALQDHGVAVAGEAWPLLLPVGFLVPLLLFALAAPLYGLTALLPTWEPISYEPILWTTVVAVAVLAMTLGAHLLRRRAGGSFERTGTA